MDALIKAARERQRPRDAAVFLILRYSGMRRESVATLEFERWTAGGVPGTSLVQIGGPQPPKSGNLTFTVDLA